MRFIQNTKRKEASVSLLHEFGSVMLVFNFSAPSRLHFETDPSSLFRENVPGECILEMLTDKDIVYSVNATFGESHFPALEPLVSSSKSEGSENSVSIQNVKATVSPIHVGTSDAREVTSTIKLKIWRLKFQRTAMAVSI